MRASEDGKAWARALGIDEMVLSLKKAGWTPADLKEYVGKSKRENFQALDDFAGGELSKSQDLPIYPVLLEATAVRYAMHTSHTFGHLRAVPTACPHGFRMVACNKCLKGAA